MRLYPAIDLLGGSVVRLTQGRYDDATVYGDDPVAVATMFVEQGADRVHIVDLDAARTGDPVNRGVIARVVAAVSGRALVQVGGGVRSVADARELSDAGVWRVVMGSAAVADPTLVTLVADVVPVAVGLDHRGGSLAVEGWTRDSGVELADLAVRMEGAAAFVVTDISRDGMLTGPDTDGLARLAAATEVPVVASGGVGTLDHLAELVRVGSLEGVITGRALYENRFTVAEAIVVLGGRS
ncbi:MAG: 1-(5-phosphoribosyl)-5-[(5-phosphoribosylamino) methylideneamino] imidazole-4-carboxamide isomerase [Actinomycetota bacterium]